MYEHLDRLSGNASELLAELSPVEEDILQEMRDQQDGCPEEYLVFLRERGYGGLEEGFMFFFEKRLIDAETELFMDKDIYKFGALGPVKIFGSEWRGINYGFDTGDSWRLVQVDPDRTVTKLDLSFKEFIEGLFICFPHFPVSCEDGKWKLATGEEYIMPK